MKVLNKSIFAALGLMILSIFSVQSNAALIEINTVSNTELGSNFDLDISISDLASSDLSSFYIDLAFDSSLLNFNSYTLGTTLIDSVWGQWDLSGGETSNGIVNIGELSWLIDFSTQPDNFVLATLNFTAVSNGVADFSIDYFDLTDENNNTLTNVTTGKASVSVPEPTSVALLVLSLMGLTLARRKA